MATEKDISNTSSSDGRVDAWSCTNTVAGSMGLLSTNVTESVFTTTATTKMPAVGLVDTVREPRNPSP
jgi:hypothetical protein